MHLNIKASRARQWLDKLFTRLGMPSAAPMAHRDRGRVVWFGVTYELRHGHGEIPGAGVPTEPVIVSKLPSRLEIGRIVGASRALELSLTSTKKVDERALRQVAAAWFSEGICVRDAEGDSQAAV